MKKPEVDHVYVIAEAGVNHNGSIELGCKLIDVASEAGADAVKFQTFKAKSLAVREAPTADYQARHGETSQFDMLKRLELDSQSHFELLKHCKEKKIEFLSTPFDVDSLRFLVEKVGVSRIKLSSGDITNGPLLLASAQTGLPVILSTGMSTLAETEMALGILAFGYTASGDVPSSEAFERAFHSERGQKALRDRVTLLHCTTEYPAPLEDINLRAMKTMGDSFGMPVGYSDHSKGISIPVAAAALGAEVVEKHFTLDRNLPGPDHMASLEPDELKRMVRSIREVEIALGSSLKRPAASEMGHMAVARKSLVAACDIRRGETFSEDNLAVKRPGNGISPVHYWAWLGRIADQDYVEDDQIG